MFAYKLKKLMQKYYFTHGYHQIKCKLYWLFLKACFPIDAVSRVRR